MRILLVEDDPTTSRSIELRDQRTATRRLMKAAADREQAKMRRDRPTGFVMLRLGDVAPAPPGRV